MFCDPDNALSSFLYLYDNFSPAMVINTDPSTQQHTIVVVCIVAPIFSSLFAAIRIWTRIFVTHSIGRDDCKLPHLFLFKASLSHNTDASLVTLVMLTLAFTHCSLTNEIRTAILHSLQCSCWFRYACCPSSVNLPAHQAPGTNYGFGWHTADVPSDRFVFYYKVQDSRHLL